MGKRNFRKGGKGKKLERSNDRSQPWAEAVRESEVWENYYKGLGIIPESEWEDFKKHCQANLPMTFRITGSKVHSKEVNAKFINDHVTNLEKVEIDGQKIAPKNLKFYPDQLGWQLDVHKSVIRKNPEFAKTQRFLVMETEVGNISRQEAVSMIPPLLLDVQPHHAVLDLCAAPGSKTAQLVEALHANDNELPTGFVLANDLDYKRCHMLTHQVKRLNSPNFMVVNHDAQLFPRMRLNGHLEYLKFDRILCDVPCSGDGTMRKNYNVWKDFTVGNALGLHPLQINILNRGLQLLKKGGRLVYSTCSLSPIENEAVVAAALRKWGSEIRLVNCENELPGLVRRSGLSDWKVFGKDMSLKSKGDEGIVESAFPPSQEEADKFNLHNCIRVYPHLQNTGGFFITVFEKVDSEVAKRPAEQPEGPAKKQKTETTVQVAKKPKMPRDANEEPFVFLGADHAELNKCFPFYDISEEFSRDCFLVRNATGEAVRTIYWVAPIIRDILQMDEQKLKIVHGGIKIFASQRNDTGLCAWRVQNESLHVVKKYLGPKRHVVCNLALLEILFQEAFPKLDYIKEKNIDPEFIEKVAGLEEGCIFLTVKREGDVEDLFLPLWKGKTNLNLMVNKKDTQELLYRVFDIETSAKDAGKETAYQQKVEAEKKEKSSEPAAEAEVAEAEAAE